jgi:diaminopimelate epimerase
VNFYKYQGAGNDFIMFDQRSNQWLCKDDAEKIKTLCDRRFGIGADGLILLQYLDGYDFEMIYFNADGRESSMCGNGGRCIAAFAKHLDLVEGFCKFMAIDGVHKAHIKAVDAQKGDYWVELLMSDVKECHSVGDDFVLNTGSPHYIRFVKDVLAENMVEIGKNIRYSPQFEEVGINVNIVSETPLEEWHIRTYERGVEDETLACGTGVTAAALAVHRRQNKGAGQFVTPFKALGGQLEVRFEAHEDGSFSNIWLCGPAVFVFEGKI